MTLLHRRHEPVVDDSETVIWTFLGDQALIDRVRALSVKPESTPQCDETRDTTWQEPRDEVKLMELRL
jgi:hypothetical protein